MYPYVRVLRVMISAVFKKKLGFNDISVLRLRVWPNDCDIYPEMNNGRHLTIMDLGRYDLAFRSGLMRMATKKKWNFVVAGISIRFRRRLPPFRRFTLRSRLAGRDERWFYFIQETIHKNKICSQAIIRAGLRDSKGLVPAEKVLDVFGRRDWSKDLPEWIREWIRAEKKRPKI